MAAGCVGDPSVGFNPRSRAGSDLPSLRSAANRSMVSIHAPARGATAQQRSLSASADEFQSTLPRGERRDEPVDWLAVRVVFQSTLPRGERLIELRHCLPHDHVSIHAPARGATPMHMQVRP